MKNLFFSTIIIVFSLFIFSGCSTKQPEKANFSEISIEKKISENEKFIKKVLKPNKGKFGFKYREEILFNDRYLTLSSGFIRGRLVNNNLIGIDFSVLNTITTCYYLNCKVVAINYLESDTDIDDILFHITENSLIEKNINIKTEGIDSINNISYCLELMEYYVKALKEKGF